MLFYNSYQFFVLISRCKDKQFLIQNSKTQNIFSIIKKERYYTGKEHYSFVTPDKPVAFI